MNPILVLGRLGVGGYVLLSSKSASAAASASPVTAAQSQAQANAAVGPTAYQGGSAAYQAGLQYGLSPADAQAAADIGLTPQEYVDSGLAGAPVYQS